MIPAAIVLLLLTAFFLRTSDDFLMRCLRPFAGTLRPVPLVPAIAAFVLLAAGLGVLAHLNRVPLAVTLPLVTLSLYVPITYVLYCDVLLIGPRREMIWACLFLLACLGSWAAFDALRMEWVVPVGVLLTTALWWNARHDPVVQYMRGLFHQHFREAPEVALRYFQRAASSRPEELRFRFHRDRMSHVLGHGKKPQLSPSERAELLADPMMFPGWERAITPDSPRHT